MTNYTGGKLKPLRDVLAELKAQPKRKQSHQEMVEAMRVIRATMGG